MPRTPAAGGRTSSVTVRATPHRATFPKGKAMCSAQSTGFAKVRIAVTPAAGGRPSSVTVRAAPHRATFPKGKAMCSAHSTGEPRSGTNYFCARLHILLSGSFCVSLPQSFVAAKRQQNPALLPRRYPLTLWLRYLAFADGSGLPFSLHPPLAALESQTPQREPRALPRRTQICRRRHCATVRPDLPRRVLHNF